MSRTCLKTWTVFIPPALHFWYIYVKNIHIEYVADRKNCNCNSNCAANDFYYILARPNLKNVYLNCAVTTSFLSYQLLYIELFLSLILRHLHESWTFKSNLLYTNAFVPMSFWWNFNQYAYKAWTLLTKNHTNHMNSLHWPTKFNVASLDYTEIQIDNFDVR